jgi:nicotinamide riboside kinase
MSNIFIVGPQCTGKTTLVNALEREIASDTTIIEKPQIISEVARTILKRHSFVTEEIRTSKARCLELQKLIQDGQAQAEAEALSTASWFISDRSGIDPIVYARRYVGMDAAREMEASTTWRLLRDRMSKSIIFLCESETAWLQNDGVRLMPDGQSDWNLMYRIFREVLEKASLRYYIVPNTMQDIKERVDFVFQVAGLKTV